MYSLIKQTSPLMFNDTAIPDCHPDTIFFPAQGTLGVDFLVYLIEDIDWAYVPTVEVEPTIYCLNVQHSAVGQALRLLVKLPMLTATLTIIFPTRSTLGTDFLGPVVQN